MALFNKKTAVSAEKGTTKTATASMARGYAHVLKHARITEKATMLSGENCYTFDIASSATKRDVVSAVRALYGVVPAKVSVVSNPIKRRRNMRTGVVGKTGGGKKAYIYLKKDDTINLA